MRRIIITTGAMVCFFVNATAQTGQGGSVIKTGKNPQTSVPSVPLNCEIPYQRQMPNYMPPGNVSNVDDHSVPVSVYITGDVNAPITIVVNGGNASVVYTTKKHRKKSFITQIPRMEFR